MLVWRQLSCQSNRRSLTPQTGAAATIPKLTHHTATLNGDELHYVTAGTDGTPVLLVHGFPETWWAFHKLIPLLAGEHRIIAVDLPGFGPGPKTNSVRYRPCMTAEMLSRT